MFGIGVPELLMILVIGLIVFGPGKLPEIGRALGKTINEFKKVTSSITLEPAPPKRPPQVSPAATTAMKAETATVADAVSAAEEPQKA